MFYGFQAAAEAANLTTILISFDQIILCEYNFFRNHKKILIFEGSFIHQISCLTLTPLLRRWLYIDWTEKDPFL